MKMKRDILKEILAKFKLQSPPPDDIKKKMIQAKKKILINVLKSQNNYNLKTRIVYAMALKAKSLGFEIKSPGTIYLLQTGFVTAIIAIAVSVALVVPRMVPVEKPVVVVKKTKGIITFVTGNAYIISPDGKRNQVKIKDTIDSNTIITTEKNGLVTVQVENVGVIRIMADTKMYFTAIASPSVPLTPEKTKLTEVYLSKGGIFSNLKKLSRDSYNIRTKTCTVAVRGTTFLTEYRKNTSAVQLLEGKVVVFSNKTPDKEQQLRKGQQAIIDTLARIKINNLTEIEKFELKKLALHPYIPDAEKKSIKELINIFKSSKKDEKKIDQKINTIINNIKTFNNLPPLEKLKRTGKIVYMFHLQNGAKLAGAIVSQDEKNIRVDTGEGIANVPKKNIIRREQLN